MPERFNELITDSPDLIFEFKGDSDGEEALGGSDEDPDIPTDKIIIDYRGS